MHLVTGRAGTPHINSDMVGRFNAGVIGGGSYIFNTQDQLACTIEDANTVSIATGDAVIQGRNVTNEAPVSLSVQSGAQGVSRYDLVCIRYENSGGIETASLVVITGTPSATPTDPSYNDGSILDGALVVDIPVYRLVINGVSLEHAERLVDVIKPFEEKQQAIGTRLFSGTWSQGETKTVDGLNGYYLFAVLLQGAATYMLAFSAPTDSNFRAFGGYVNTTPNVFAYAATFTRNGETLTLVKAGNVNVTGTTVTSGTVVGIYGIV